MSLAQPAPSPLEPSSPVAVLGLSLSNLGGYVLPVRKVPC